ncbi:PaaX family transcriptional regulator [Amycolatopsis sp. OK19-0408]|uniref:PaaX family transcriptional regulator n=1 Tax=Amycolatopsis iheyensis TaxID=2945988 RepID=A0A9X2NE36_9PSEU|nr:PaaX family transcriptional regulator C-terminal domain-containing protein [Amycolatopsis iheyensis]MCR6485014.1 PaaX family transcriptional regulator [Amycolatopsis iheyensis]
MVHLDEPNSGPRPKSVMLTFLGIHLLDRASAVYSGSVIDVFGRVGVSAEAVRSTLSRMAGDGLLTRHRQGRKVYFGLSERLAAVLADGRRRIWETGAVNRSWDGGWTLVGFSLPDTRRGDRHDLRRQLTWAGFGLLQNGLWVASGVRDVTSIVERLGLAGHVTVFTADPAKPTEAAELVRKAFDTETIALRYQDFLAKWDTGRSALPDDLTRQLMLHTDWLHVVRRDPHLPAEHLPADWPAIRAEQLFRKLDEDLRDGAEELARETLELMTPGATAPVG